MEETGKLLSETVYMSALLVGLKHCSSSGGNGSSTQGGLVVCAVDLGSREDGI